MYVYTNETVASEAECVALVKAQYGDPSKNCQSCHLSCEEHDYERTVTTASWPSNKYWVRKSSTKKDRLPKKYAKIFSASLSTRRRLPAS